MAGHPVFAAIYDRLMASTERDGLREMRAQLLADASGRTLEVGAGTGLGLPHYTDAVTELVLTEPDPHMARRLRAALPDSGPAARAEVLETGAEALPFDDASFDTVVSALCLCTVADQPAAIAEIQRVLRPGGKLLFVEHVRSEDSERLARWQDRLERPWGWLAGGCHPNRRTVSALAAAGLEADAESRRFPGKPPPLVRPLVIGAAKKPA